MKNNGIILSIVVLFLLVSISGCQEQNNQNGNQQINNSTNHSNGNHTTNNTNGTQQQNTTENAFLGDWEVIGVSPDYETWSFYKNFSAKNYLSQEFENNIISTISWFDYTNDATTFRLSTKNELPDSPNYVSILYSYVISENATHLSLSSNGIVIMDLDKMPG